MRPSRQAYADAHKGVGESADLYRILSLPRRIVGPESVDVDAWTDFLRVPGGRMRLFFNQALALAELSRVGGLIVVEEAGSGKTLIGILAATILNAQRPLYLCPASSLRQVVEESWPEAIANWRVNDNLRFLSYSALSSQKNRELLFQQMPDLIICDEAHSFKNEHSARTNRFLEFVNKFPQTRVIPMTGTPTVKNLQECAHYYLLALRGAAPVPTVPQERALWADALGSDLPREHPLRPQLGALNLFTQFLTDEERHVLTDPLDRVRAGYGRRLAQTPGVIQQEELAVKIPIVVRFPKLNVSLRVREAFGAFRSAGITPGGEIAVDAKEQARSARELIFGFYYRWVWPNGIRNDAWVEARAGFSKFCRNKIMYDKDSRLDTRGLVERACEAWEMYTWAKRSGEKALAQRFIDQGIPMLDSEAYRRWKAVEHEYTPVTEAVWIDEYMLDAIQEWMSKNVGLVWIEHVAVGEALRKRGVPYFGGGDDTILDERNRVPLRSVAASLSSHYQAKNLQAWHRCLYPLPPSNGAIWEQSLARFHRPKQTAECIYADVWAPCQEAYRAFDQALEDARYASRITTKPQRLMRAAITGRLGEREIAELIAAGDPLWT